MAADGAAAATTTAAHAGGARSGAGTGSSGRSGSPRRSGGACIRTRSPGRAGRATRPGRSGRPGRSIPGCSGRARSTRAAAVPSAGIGTGLRIGAAVFGAAVTEGRQIGVGGDLEVRAVVVEVTAARVEPVRRHEFD